MRLFKGKRGRKVKTEKKHLKVVPEVANEDKDESLRGLALPPIQPTKAEQTTTTDSIIEEADDNDDNVTASEKSKLPLVKSASDSVVQTPRDLRRFMKKGGSSSNAPGGSSRKSLNASIHSMQSLQSLPSLKSIDETDSCLDNLSFTFNELCQDEGMRTETTADDNSLSISEMSTGSFRLKSPADMNQNNNNARAYVDTRELRRFFMRKGGSLNVSGSSSRKMLNSSVASLQSMPSLKSINETDTCVGSSSHLDDESIATFHTSYSTVSTLSPYPPKAVGKLHNKLGHREEYAGASVETLNPVLTPLHVKGKQCHKWVTSAAPESGIARSRSLGDLLVGTTIGTEIGIDVAPAIAQRHVSPESYGHPSIPRTKSLDFDFPSSLILRQPSDSSFVLTSPAVTKTTSNTTFVAESPANTARDTIPRMVRSTRIFSPPVSRGDGAPPQLIRRTSSNSFLTTPESSISTLSTLTSNETLRTVESPLIYSA